ncbi:MAG TPA: hypothetical protein EYQ37_04555 [Candidatus Marinimicrobia bacterium]|jgi:hypothetical protein|nr:hypothetical protein [Candidatus Neomarinimicrobiota bacterium]
MKRLWVKASLLHQLSLRREFEVIFSLKSMPLRLRLFRIGIAITVLSAGLILPLISSHQKSVVPMGHNTILKKDDCITCLVRKEKMDVFHEWVASSPFSV